MRIYLSGGITGITDYMQRFVDADNHLFDRHYEKVDRQAQGLGANSLTAWDIFCRQTAAVA